ncbi:hypothetical protein FFLO_04914 [Filobasidium floriforme]|uniref:CRAL-TRIO domain-containing protein n=1 Tax=Filobasidium floriforme TaxID=5210 RepID=A0A8K0JJ78_9TREE|nr:hypothetical protein FFLO_04914 [Filobasidium floriforme]
MSSFDFQTFLHSPSSSSVPAGGPEPISADQQEKLDELIKKFGDEKYVLEGEKLTGWEMSFLSREGLLRFLRADKYDLQLCIDRIERCLIWRRKEGMDDLEGLAKRVEGEQRTKGGQFVFGYDKSSRPVIFMHPSRREEPPSELGLVHLFYLFERAIDLMPKHVEKTAFLIDLGGKRKHSTPIGLAKEWVSVLQSCYPERLGLGIIANAPWALSMFLSLVLRFCDPATRAKIVVAGSSDQGKKLIADTVAEDQLQAEYGGKHSIPWDVEVHERYWPALIEVCRKRRAFRLKRWQELGGTVGISEEEWKGRDE